MIQLKAKDKSGEVYNSALSPFTFPAGEAHIKREDRRDLGETEIAVLYGSKDMHNDLFQLAMWNDYLTNTNKRARRVLVLPYIPGARADRGHPFGLMVYADFISNLHLDQIVVFDPHSEASVQLLKSWSYLDVVDSDELLKDSSEIGQDYVGVIAPDKGAVHRAQGVADALGVPLFKAEKTRDFDSGKLTGFTCEPLPTGRLLLVDDICDGGGTFLGLANALGLAPSDLDLYVSHGVFSGNALLYLPQRFHNIFTTNSYDPSRDLNLSAMGDYTYRHKPFRRLNIIDTLFKRIK